LPLLISTLNSAQTDDEGAVVGTAMQGQVGQGTAHDPNPILIHPAMIPKRASSVHDIRTHNPPFGSRKVPTALTLLSLILTRFPRFLTESADVWSQNAWDHVPPPVDQDATIAASLARQRAAPVPDDDKDKYNAKPAKHWFVPNRLI
jgi:tRNAThr (cytosine32-N3)-methyltransferase